MRIRFGCTIALLGLSATVLAQPPQFDRLDIEARAACNALGTLELPELASIRGTWVEAGPLTVPGTAAANAGPSQLPAHCRVEARIEPSIRFEVWLPAPTGWNGRFLGIGGGGYAGTIAYTELADALLNGYAAASTDTGHAEGDYAWLADDGLLRDFGYRAIYEMTAKSAVIVREFYARPADYRYFNGCSLGGRQGLMEAERFPSDYDGIVAGAPVNAFVATRTTQLVLTRFARPVPGQTLLGGDALRLLNTAVIEQCDTLDGVADGVLEDPRRCNFDPRRLQCGFTPAGRCLTPDQIEAARQIYAGPASAASASFPAGRIRSPFGAGSSGQPPQSPFASAGASSLPAIELPGLAPGSETGWTFAASDELSPLTLEFFRRAVFADMFWNWRDFDLAIDHPYAEEQVGWMLDADSADLIDFRDRGGKLILYHGWNDTNNAPEATIGYYEAVEATAATAPNSPGLGTRDFARLFMVPGMGHCGGGVGTSSFDSQRAIEDWVERGIAPDRIEAERSENGAAVRTRPLCPYPQTARYRGTGNTDRSGSFVCTN